MRSANSFPSATAWHWPPLSTASSAGSARVCAMMAMPMRTCPVLHGWRRYGKRSPARRAIPQTTISSESPLFSRCFRCSRKRHAKQAIVPQTLSFQATKEFVVATRKKSSKKKKAKNVASAAAEKRAKKAVVKKTAKKTRKAAKKPATKKAAKKAAKKSARKSAKAKASKPASAQKAKQATAPVAVPATKPAAPKP